MSSGIVRSSIGHEVSTRLTATEVAELERRAAQFGVECSELIHRYVCAALAVPAVFGTVVDFVTGEPLVPATEPHVTVWLSSHNSASAPGIFAINSDNQPVALFLAKLTDRRVTIINPPEGLDTANPGSLQNLRVLATLRSAACHGTGDHG